MYWDTLTNLLGGSLSGSSWKVAVSEGGDKNICSIHPGGMPIVDDTELGRIYCMCYLLDWAREWKDFQLAFGSPVNDKVGKFVVDKRYPIQQVMASKSRDFADNPLGKWIVMLGPSGAGKTHLMYKIYQSMLGACVYITDQDFTTLVMSCLKDGNLEHLIDELSSAPVLIYDDLLHRRVNSAVTDDVISQVLNNRWTFSKPTAITSNWSRSELSGPGLDAIASRIFSEMSEVVDCAGVPDYRRMPHG